jgi:GAF domain-containing protein
MALMVDELLSDARLDLAEAVAALAGIVLGSLSFDDVLNEVVDIAKRTVDGAFEVSITVAERSPQTAASTSPFAVAVDERQYQAGYGPCLDALRHRTTVVVADQATETRWRAYTPRAVEAGVGSSVSVPLDVDDKPVGALNIYGNVPHAFSLDAIATAEQLGQYASVVLNNAGLYFSATARAEQMAEAMQTRAVIEQAKGVLMCGRRCTADDAFGVLVKLSQQSGRKLHAVAKALIDQIPGNAPLDL